MLTKQTLRIYSQYAERYSFTKNPTLNFVYVTLWRALLSDLRKASTKGASLQR